MPRDETYLEVYEDDSLIDGDDDEFAAPRRVLLPAHTVPSQQFIASPSAPLHETGARAAQTASSQASHSRAPRRHKNGHQVRPHGQQAGPD